MAEGLDISQYPPMGPELVAPVVGWLAHESCSVTGEMYVSMAAASPVPSLPRRKVSTGRTGPSMPLARISMRSAIPTAYGRSIPLRTAFSSTWRKASTWCAPVKGAHSFAVRALLWGSGSPSSQATR
jgi:hypothetical protein